MASQDYLIAIALIEQNLIRAMPLGGKEIKDNLEESENFKKLGEEVILNLLMRVFQRISFFTILFSIVTLKHFLPLPKSIEE